MKPIVKHESSFRTLNKPQIAMLESEFSQVRFNILGNSHPHKIAAVLRAYEEAEI